MTGLELAAELNEVRPDFTDVARLHQRREKLVQRKRRDAGRP